MQPSQDGAHAPPMPAAEDQEALDYFGAIAPQEGTVLWYGRRVSLLFKITDGGDEGALLSSIAALPTKEQRALAEAHYRMARAVLAVGGQEVRFPSFEAKLAWVKRWPMPLLDAAMAAYEVVAFEPIKALEGMDTDPSSDAGPAATGSSGGQPADQPTDS